MPFKNINGYRIGFVSFDGTEPRHVHVVKDGQAKIWLDTLEVAESSGFSAGELKKIVRIVQEHQQELVEMWNEYFQR